jgi:hypothetical protein
MGLKFRRGTTAQQSGSLAFGEPYVNTTLGTLVIGGDNGDIILSSTGTGSTGNFGAISGSGLDITGNANIGGNLNINGNFTIGNQTSDNVNIVASLSSSLIPQTTNVFDLGSASKIWRDLYISTGSIKFVDPGTGNVVGTLSSNAGGDFKVAGDVSGSTINGLGNATEYSSSVAYRLVNLESDMFNVTSSVQALNRWTGSIATTASVNALSSSAYSTFAKLNGGNTFTGNQIISASVYVTGDMVVYGSSSLQNITASAVSIGTNTVILNTDTPSVRFGGISVQDSGSGAGVSGSLLWDSQNNHWIYQHPIGGAESGMSGRVISGPKNSGSLGEEAGLTVGQIPVASGDDHLSDSIISASVTKVTVSGDLDVTGNVSASTISGIGNATAYSTSVASRITSLEGTDITITLTGDVTGTGTITNLGNVSFATTVAANQVALGTDTTGDYVASLVAGTGVTLSNNSGESATPTIAIGQSVATSANAQFNSLGIGMAASATAGRIDATNDIVAYSSSDIRFKENIKPIENALDKISKISGNTYDWKEENKIEHGYEGNDVGVIAQEIEAVLPQLVQTRENGYKAVKYDKLVALLIEGIKEQQTQIHSLTIEIENLKKNNSL